MSGSVRAALEEVLGDLGVHVPRPTEALEVSLGSLGLPWNLEASQWCPNTTATDRERGRFQLYGLNVNEMDGSEGGPKA